MRKANRQISQISAKYPLLLSSYCSLNFPPVLKPGTPDTTNKNDGRVQATIDSLQNRSNYLTGRAELMQQKADSLILASLIRKDTACANLITELRNTITSQKKELNWLNNEVGKLSYEYQYLKDHPLTVTTPVYISDSARVYTLTLQRDNANNQLAGKDGEIKQLEKTNRKKSIAITILSIIVAAGVFLKFKR